MNDLALERFETQAAETVGAMRDLFQEFERQLVQTVRSQTFANAEIQQETEKARAALDELARRAQGTADKQLQALHALREGLRSCVAENLKESGEELARAFGSQIADGLAQKLEALSEDVDAVTRRFRWVSALTWGGGIALGIALSITIGVWALLPGSSNLSWPYVYAGAKRLVRCEIENQGHVCIAIDENPRVTREPGPDGNALVVVKDL